MSKEPTKVKLTENGQRIKIGGHKKSYLQIQHEQELAINRKKEHNRKKNRMAKASRKKNRHK